MKKLFKIVLSICMLSLSIKSTAQVDTSTTQKLL